jgi:hypothetical protein
VEFTRFKIVYTVTEDRLDATLKAVGDAGAGSVGEYSYCSFSSLGLGRSMPSGNAKPFYGETGKLNQEKELRVEVTCDENKLKNVVKALRDVHPYDEPAIDVYPLIDLPD